jgi:hypothetical protein
MIESPWLTIDEAAEYSRYSERELRRRVGRGELRAGGSKRKLLFTRPDLDQMIQHGRPRIGLRVVQPKTRPAGTDLLVITDRIWGKTK